MAVAVLPNRHAHSCMCTPASRTPLEAVFELEVEDIAVRDPVDGAAAALSLQRLHQLSYPACCAGGTLSFAAKLLRDVRFYKASLAADDEACDTVTLASQLATIGYRVSIRTALGGGRGTACFHNLNNSFLVVYEDGCGGEVIVEPRFREHFQIPHPTPLYTKLLAATPEEFVGHAKQLVPLVQLLTHEMMTAFTAQGLTCPPWRQIKSALSKWLPERRQDVDFTQPSSPTSSLAFLPFGEMATALRGGQSLAAEDACKGRVGQACSAMPQSCCQQDEATRNADAREYAVQVLCGAAVRTYGKGRTHGVGQAMQAVLQPVNGNKSLLTRTLSATGAVAAHAERVRQRVIQPALQGAAVRHAYS